MAPTATKYFENLGTAQPWYLATIPAVAMGVASWVYPQLPFIRAQAPKKYPVMESLAEDIPALQASAYWHGWWPEEYRHSHQFNIVFTIVYFLVLWSVLVYLYGQKQIQRTLVIAAIAAGVIWVTLTIGKFVDLKAVSGAYITGPLILTYIASLLAINYALVEIKDIPHPN